MTIKLREYIVTLVLFSLSTSSKPEPELLNLNYYYTQLNSSYYIVYTVYYITYTTVL
jgi:hypothetical protein